MPGTTIVKKPPGRVYVDSALDSVLFKQTYGRDDIVDDEETLVSVTGYEEYPRESVEYDSWKIVLEGHIYDEKDTRSALGDIADWVDAGDIDRLSKWVSTKDGDFLITLHDTKSGDTWVINDAFGRLPTYRGKVGETTIVTRELKAIRELAAETERTDLEANRLGLAQMLLFGYPLGTRTLFDGVKQLPPGTLYLVGNDSATSLYEFRFDQYENETRSVAENAQALKDKFLDTCERRAETNETTVVSLSGGLDSRAVIAGYSNVVDPSTGGQLLAATSARADGGNTTEVNVARQVAETLNVPWDSYLADRTERHERSLLDMTQGMNNIGMSIGLNFTEQVAADHPDAAFVTGDGGDKAFPDLTPPNDPDSKGDLVETIVASNELFSLPDVESITGVGKKELVRSIGKRLESYPETTLEGQHIHFLIRERAINWLNHGEDRSRYHIWSTTPFYSLPFFTEAMSCPPAQKEGTKLYREFLSLLSPEAIEVDYVDFGAPITSTEYRLKRYGYDWLSNHPKIKQRVSRFLGGGQSDTSGTHSQQLLIETLHDRTITAGSLSDEELQRIAWSPGSYSAPQQYRLSTLIAALDGK